MNELQRQAYLKALGMTPWVAVAPLPGAASTPELDWPEASNESQALSVPSTANVVDVPVTPVPKEVPTVLPTDASIVTPGAAEPVPKAGAATIPATRITLQAHQVGEVWLLAEQDDPSAPDLSRDALQLLHNMQAIFPGERKGVRKFLWPLSDIGMDDAALQKTFLSFARGLSGRLLLCVSAESCNKLLGVERYQLLEQPVPMLAISSLTEMLAEPVRHKRESWQAMLVTGFHG